MGIEREAGSGFTDDLDADFGAEVAVDFDFEADFEGEARDRVSRAAWAAAASLAAAFNLSWTVM